MQVSLLKICLRFTADTCEKFPFTTKGAAHGARFTYPGVSNIWFGCLLIGACPVDIIIPIQVDASCRCLTWTENLKIAIVHHDFMSLKKVSSDRSVDLDSTGRVCMLFGIRTIKGGRDKLEEVSQEKDEAKWESGTREQDCEQSNDAQKCSGVRKSSQRCVWQETQPWCHAMPQLGVVFSSSPRWWMMRHQREPTSEAGTGKWNQSLEQPSLP